jgi:photosystem II stability/assembly factor-like uncharacterized protein
MNEHLILATANGLTICERGSAGWLVASRSTPGHSLTSVIAREGVILAGNRNSVYRSDDLGRSWQECNRGLEHSHVRWMAYHPDVSDFEFAGTEPAGIFVSHDGGMLWRSCPEVAQLRDRNGWYLPYSPEAGCVRGFAFHGSRAYAAVEVGGVLRSLDSGETWSLVGGDSIHPDVHSISMHPASPDLVYAPTGGGFYRSFDGGLTWKLRYDCYCRAVWIDPNDAEHILLGPADGVDRNGRIEETLDGGRTWRLASDGLDVPWRHHMVERFTQVGDELLGVLSNGELLSTDLAGISWRQILQEEKGVAAVTHLSDR